MPMPLTPFLSLSPQERLLLVQSLQARREALRENARKKRSSKQEKKKGASKKPFQFDDPAMQAMFDLVPDEFKKKFGRNP